MSSDAEKAAIYRIATEQAKTMHRQELEDQFVGSMLTLSDKNNMIAKLRLEHTVFALGVVILFSFLLYYRFFNH